MCLSCGIACGTKPHVAMYTSLKRFLNDIWTQSLEPDQFPAYWQVPDKVGVDFGLPLKNRKSLNELEYHDLKNWDVEQQPRAMQAHTGQALDVFLKPRGPCPLCKVAWCYTEIKSLDFLDFYEPGHCAEYSTACRCIVVNPTLGGTGETTELVGQIRASVERRKGEEKEVGKGGEAGPALK